MCHAFSSRAQALSPEEEGRGQDVHTGGNSLAHGGASALKRRRVTAGGGRLRTQERGLLPGH